MRRRGEWLRPGFVLAALFWVVLVALGVAMVREGNRRLGEALEAAARGRELGCDPDAPYDGCVPREEHTWDPQHDGCYEWPELCEPGELPVVRGL